MDFEKLRKKVPEALTVFEAKKELELLSSELRRYNDAYYVEDDPLVSDSIFDNLFQRNIDIEKKFPNLKRNDSPALSVGAPAKDGFGKIEHQKLMLSLNNAFSYDDINDFISRVRRFLKLSDDEIIEIICEPKIDGLSVSATYENGNFILGATRGNGVIGEDITDNLQTIDDLPKNIQSIGFPSLVEVRGEVFMPKIAFNSLNNDQELKRRKTFSNPRNAAAGSLRQLDPAITKSRTLSIFFYTTGVISSPLADTHCGTLEAIRSFGFRVNPLVKTCKSLQDVIAFCDKISAIRQSLDYEIDGVVCKVNRVDWQQRMGVASRAPRWATAYKFAAEKAETVVEEIIIQVGRTGALTPVAKLRPVNVSGVIVSRATLHNEDEIARLDIRIGDLVLLERAGDVIPKIISVDKTKRGNLTTTFNFPDKCPECGSVALRESGAVVRRCMGGIICPAQAIERLKHFVSRPALDIQGLGSRHIDELYTLRLIKTPADIFLLPHKRKILETLSGWGKKSTQNLLQSLKEKSVVDFSRFIFSLGISQVGQSIAALIAKHYETLSSWELAMEDAKDPNSEAYSDLLNIEGIGLSIAQDIVSFFREKQNMAELNRLKDLLNVKEFKNDIIMDTMIAGKTVVFTGKLENFGRLEAKAKAEELGAKVAGSISTKTDFLIAGEGDTTKLQKAVVLGIQILKEDEWLKLIKNTNA